jgi:acyl-CoA thioester hydrolase
MEKKTAVQPRGLTVPLKVRYYETDAMGIVHHSNYIRWFEVGRTEYLKAAGLPYDELEAGGTACPVIAVRCDYLRSARFAETGVVDTFVAAYSGCASDDGLCHHPRWGSAVPGRNGSCLCS